MVTEKRYKSFDAFYAFYLSEHSNKVSRRLHFIGTSVAFVLMLIVGLTQYWWLLFLALVQGYAFAWVGHFFFEHNKPATFKFPLYSFIGDWKLWWEIITRQRSL
jgi:hypothetical protein